MEDSFRCLTSEEAALLEKLLSIDVPGRDKLKLQMNSVTARPLLGSGLELRSHEPLRAEMLSGCPVEGTCPDSDGTPIAVLLHVRDGKLHLLEIFREDGEEIIRPPDASTIRVY